MSERPIQIAETGVWGSIAIGGGEVAVGQSITPITGTYITDDWGDNNLSSRTDPTDNFFNHPAVNEPGDILLGRDRPSWETESGSPSVSSQQLELSAGDTTAQRVAVQSLLTIGSWEIDFEFASDPTSGNFFFECLAEASNRIRVQVEDAGAYNLNFGGVTQVSSTWGDDLNNHTARADRDAFGNFELFLDGTSQGTASNTSDPGEDSGSEMELENTTDAQVNLDNLDTG